MTDTMADSPAHTTTTTDQMEQNDTYQTESPRDTSSTEDLVLNSTAPPSLDYSIAARKWKITFFWGLILFDSIAMPLGLYFGLWYGTNLSPNAVFSIVTAALGGISIYEYVIRFWELWKKKSTCRVINGQRKHLDWFHWCFTAMWFVVMCELIIGTCFKNPPIRLLSMPLATVIWVFGTELLIIDGLRLLGVPNLFRISSLPKGAQQRPGIYNIIEDIIAVDGGGGTEYRKRLSIRYEASHTFRQMLHRLTLFWAIGAEATAILCTILIFVIDSGDAAFVIGWTVPFVWAGFWTLATWWYVERCLKFERENWNATTIADLEAGTSTDTGVVEKPPRISTNRPVHALEHVRIRTSLSTRPRMSTEPGRMSMDRTRISIDQLRDSGAGRRRSSVTQIDTSGSDGIGRRKSSGQATASGRKSSVTMRNISDHSSHAPDEKDQYGPVYTSAEPLPVSPLSATGTGTEARHGSGQASALGTGAASPTPSPLSIDIDKRLDHHSGK